MGCVVLTRASEQGPALEQSSPLTGPLPGWRRCPWYSKAPGPSWLFFARTMHGGGAAPGPQSNCPCASPLVGSSFLPGITKDTHRDTRGPQFCEGSPGIIFILETAVHLTAPREALTTCTAQ